MVMENRDGQSGEKESDPGLEEGTGGFLRRQYGRKGILKMAILAAVTVAVLVSLVIRVDAGKLWQTLEGAAPALLLAAIVLASITPVAGSLRWFLLLRASGERVPFSTCIRVLYAALPANVLTPSKAGDLLRSVFLRDRVEIWKGMGIILTERLIDVSVLATMALVGSLVTELRAVTFAALAVLGLVVGVFVAASLRIRLPLGERLRSKLDQLFEGARSLGKKPAWLAAVAAASALLWATNIIIATICFHALGTPVDLVNVVAAMPIAIFVGLVPVTLSGMGTRDSALVVLLADIAPRATCLSVGLIYSLLLYWMLALVGLPLLRSVLKASSHPRIPGAP